tara:strand:- start:1356 stop:1592 length:237 start_codon:yes stop_codon:yes gene_type:complete
MSKRMFEFRCAEKHTVESYVDETVNALECPVCQCMSLRIISAPRISLEGVTGDFPTAADAWARKHEEATRIAEKRREG